MFSSVLRPLHALVGFSSTETSPQQSIQDTQELRLHHFIPGAARNCITSFLFLGNNPLLRDTRPCQMGSHAPRRRSQEEVSIPVEMGGESRTLDARHQIAPGRTVTDPTVVLFHGNCSSYHTVQAAGDHFLQQGYNVLMATISGYPGSSYVETSEGTIYQDIEAIKCYLAAQGVAEAGYYGLSLGGSLAFQAAVGQSNHAIKTLFLVADQTFTTASEAAGQLTANTRVTSLFSVAKACLELGLPTGKGVYLGGRLVVYTDGLNNLKKAQKVKEMNIPLFLFHSNQDVIMGANLAPEGCYQDNMADQLARVRYEDPDERKQHQFTLQGPHGTSYLHDPAAVEALNSFLFRKQRDRGIAASDFVATKREPLRGICVGVDAGVFDVMGQNAALL